MGGAELLIGGFVLLALPGANIVMAAATGKIAAWNPGRGDPLRFVDINRDAPSFWVHLMIWIILLLVGLTLLMAKFIWPG